MCDDPSPRWAPDSDVLAQPQPEYPFQQQVQPLPSPGSPGGAPPCAWAARDREAHVRRTRIDPQNGSSPLTSPPQSLANSVAALALALLTCYRSLHSNRRPVEAPNPFLSVYTL